MADLDFIRRCAREGRVFWSYHASMRLGEAAVTTEAILATVATCEVVEDYPKDFPLPSCLCLAWGAGGRPYHYVIAEDRAGENIRFVTVYRPDPLRWSSDFRQRVGKDRGKE